MSRRSGTGTRARGRSLFFVDEFQAFDMATTKSGQCSLCGSCTFGLQRQTRTISSIPFVCGRDFPSRICFSPVDRRYFGREEFTFGVSSGVFAQFWQAVSAWVVNE
ncbi:hypothetical protein AVEN_52278-1 [Araneus ventricosus]|uniref:Uncharacterized protein n=1 Tax=Araneus ventricosus TaxID=182803 RepID=A0A4Y2LM59_ARAVE|nr:hypothetical protein AVEN_52278-1 [Araneus ventricosus]